MEMKIAPKAQHNFAAKQERRVVLSAQKLVKIYGTGSKRRTVVNGVSFEVREGEIVGLLGSNGAGKTTSFRMACGLIQPDKGTIILNGIDVTNWPMHRRTHDGRLGYLPQDRSTFGALTTEENLIGAMQFLGYTKAQQRAKLDECLVKFNLTHIRKTKVGYGGSGGLSGGERRRLEIARALLSNPKILLLDEPFANVDPITVEEMQKVILELVRDNVSILITDHQVEETLAITDRSYIVNRGEVLCSGSPSEVLKNQRAIDTYFGKRAESLQLRFQSTEQQRRGYAQFDAPKPREREQEHEQEREQERETIAEVDSQDRASFSSIGLRARKSAERDNAANTMENNAASRPSLTPRETPTVPAPSAQTSTTGSTTQRRTLGLTRRDPGVVKETPAPKVDKTPNRFESKLHGLFNRKK